MVAPLSTFQWDLVAPREPCERREFTVSYFDLHENERLALMLSHGIFSDDQGGRWNVFDAMRNMMDRSLTIWCWRPTIDPAKTHHERRAINV